MPKFRISAFIKKEKNTVFAVVVLGSILISEARIPVIEVCSISYIFGVVDKSLIFLVFLSFFLMQLS